MKRIVIVALALVALVAGAVLLLRPAAAETCFDRLGGPGPNSNTPRLDTILDIPLDQWPAVATEMKAFAAAHGWQVEDGPGRTDPTFFWLDMCDSGTTFVRASNRNSAEGGIGFGIIHMKYDGPEREGWQPLYRDLHRRLETRWPGRLSYIGGEFMQPMPRPDWLGDAPAPAQAAPGP
jgi:hypothetical protein